MRKITKCLGIDLGATSVKVAQVERIASGVAITKLVWMARDTNADLAVSIRNLIKSNGITAKHAVFSLYGHQVFLRGLSIPRSSDERVRRIVMYEAKQQIPFPFEEAIIDYQIFDTDNPAEVFVHLGAVRRETVAELMTIAERCGLSPVGVTVSSLALFNFFALESTPFKDFQRSISGAARKASTTSKRKKGFALFGKKKNTAVAVAAQVLSEDENETAPDFDNLINEHVACQVNIGATTIDVVISRYRNGESSLGFARTISEGVALVDKLIEKQLGVTPEQAAEFRIQQGMVLSSGAEGMADQFGKNEEVSKLITKWAERLAINLRKTYEFFMSMPDGSPIDEVIISGGGSSFLNLTEYLEEKLGVPVSLKTEITGDSIKTNVAEPIGSFIESVGLALDGLGLARVAIDFLPEDLQALRDFSRHKIEAGVLVALLVAVLGTSAFVGTSQTTARRMWLNREQSKITDIRNIKQQLDAASAAREKVSKDLSGVVGGVQDRMYWLDFLAFLSNATPPAVTLTRLELFADGRALIQFKTDDLAARAAFEEALATNKKWVKGHPTSIEIYSSYNPSSAGTVEHNYQLDVALKHKTTRLQDARSTILPGLLEATKTPAVADHGGGMMGGGPPLPMGGAGNEALP